jgi:hypothetical protein
VGPGLRRTTALEICVPRVDLVGQLMPKALISKVVCATSTLRKGLIFTKRHQPKASIVWAVDFRLPGVPMEPITGAERSAQVRS